MLFLLVLIAAYAGLWLATRSVMTVPTRARLALAAGMAVAGVAHLVAPVPFIQHLPDIIPSRDAIVFVSGLVEIAFGVLLLGPARYRAVVGILLAGYLVAVFPGNLYVAIAGVDVEGQPGGLYSWLRLPLQAVFIWLALWSTRALAVIPVRLVPASLRGVAGASV